MLTSIILVNIIPTSRISSIQRSRSGQITTIQILTCRIGLQIVRFLNLQTSLQVVHCRVASTHVNVGRASSHDTKHVLILGVATIGLRRSNVQCCGCSTSVSIGHCRLQYIIERSVSIPAQHSVRRIDLIVNTNHGTTDELLVSSCNSRVLIL